MFWWVFPLPHPLLFSYIHNLYGGEIKRGAKFAYPNSCSVEPYCANGPTDFRYYALCTLTSIGLLMGAWIQESILIYDSISVTA